MRRRKNGAFVMWNHNKIGGDILYGPSGILLAVFREKCYNNLEHQSKNSHHVRKRG
jgi:hypothetical protein